MELTEWADSDHSPALWSRAPGGETKVRHGLVHGAQRGDLQPAIHSLPYSCFAGKDSPGLGLLEAPGDPLRFASDLPLPDMATFCEGGFL